MALQHRIKWEIALSSRKRAKISNFLLKALSRRCRRARPKTTKAIQKWKPHLMEAKSWKTAFFFQLLQYAAASLVMVRLQQSFLKQTLLLLLLFSKFLKFQMGSVRWMCGCLHRGFLICFDSQQAKNLCLLVLSWARLGIFMLDFEISSLGLFCSHCQWQMILDKWWSGLRWFTARWFSKRRSGA